jgi:hypothetical protein
MRISGWTRASAPATNWGSNATALAHWHYHLPAAKSGEEPCVWGALIGSSCKSDGRAGVMRLRTPQGPRPKTDVFGGAGMRVIRTSIQAPNANAHIEHWAGSVRRECLDRLLIFSRRQVDHVMRIYVRDCNERRPHRALDLQVPGPLRIPSTRGDPARSATVIPTTRPAWRTHPRIRGRRSMRPS